MKSIDSNKLKVLPKLLSKHAKHRNTLHTELYTLENFNKKPQCYSN